MDLSVKDAARLLEVDEETVYRRIEHEGLPANRVGKRYRLNREELLEWATSHGIRFSPDLLREESDSSLPLPGVAEALEAGGIYYGISGPDKTAVLTTVVEHLRLPPDVDRSFILQVLLAREALGTTAIGEGVAIPHPRTPIVLNVSHPTVALLFLKVPVDFGALDGKAVSILFTLISPTIRTHLHVLSRLAFMLHDPAFRAALDRQAPPEFILAEARRIQHAVRNSAPNTARPGQ
ncbi:MAG: PTS sugar transporter subunit IIA [Lentisphaerae bacterium]|nr:PTS sugar transporter subunit IIA [Lentisphaerota bacterium]